MFAVREHAYQSSFLDTTRVFSRRNSNKSCFCDARVVKARVPTTARLPPKPTTPILPSNKSLYAHVKDVKEEGAHAHVNEEGARRLVQQEAVRRLSRL
jgi:hypothetical protein